MIRFILTLAAIAGLCSGQGGFRGGGAGFQGGAGGPGGRGGPEGPGGPFGGDFEDVVFANLTCTDVAGEPDCALPFPRRGGEDVLGTWVCRTLYNPITGAGSSFSACINTTRALETDTCGCCDGTCPDPCGCTCDLDDTADGVIVLHDHNFPNGTSTTEARCVSPERAVTMVARGTRFTCATDCSVTVDTFPDDGP